MYTYMGNSVADTSFSTVSYTSYYGNTEQARDLKCNKMNLLPFQQVYPSEPFLQGSAQAALGVIFLLYKTQKESINQITEYFKRICRKTSVKPLLQVYAFPSLKNCKLNMNTSESSKKEKKVLLTVRACRHDFKINPSQKDQELVLH